MSPSLEPDHVIIILYIDRLNIVIEGQILVANNKQGEVVLIIRQPFLEGMLPYEYALILKALKKL